MFIISYNGKNQSKTNLNIYMYNQNHFALHLTPIKYYKSTIIVNKIMSFHHVKLLED